MASRKVHLSGKYSLSIVVVTVMVLSALATCDGSKMLKAIASVKIIAVIRAKHLILFMSHFSLSVLIRYPKNTRLNPSTYKKWKFSIMIERLESDLK